MNKTLTQRFVNGHTYNILALPDTNLFIYEQVCLLGAHIERAIFDIHGTNLFGMSHLVEHLSFRATQDYTTEELTRLLKTEGTHNASTSHDRINYWFKTTMDRMDIGIRLVCNYAMNDLIKIPEEEFLIERKVVSNEVKRYNDDDQTMFYFNMVPALCGNHADDNILGNADVIDTFELDDAIFLKNIFLNNGHVMHNITYDPSVSNIDDIISKVEAELLRFNYDKNDYSDIIQKTEELLTAPEICSVKMDNDANQALTGLVLDVVDNIHTTRLGNNYLANYSDTSLNDVIREKHGLTYGIYLYDDLISYVNYAIFSCDVSRGDEDLLIDLFKQSINDSVDNFTPKVYAELMKTIRLKRVMTFINQQHYLKFINFAIWNSKLFDEVADSFANDINKALTELDNKYGTYEEIKCYLEKVRESVNAEDYGFITNV